MAGRLERDIRKERRGNGKGTGNQQERTSSETKGQDLAVSKGMKKWTGVHRVKSVTS